MTIIPHNFTARNYQVDFLLEVQRAIEGRSKKRRFMQIWHRRSGKDKTNIADVVPRRLVLDPVLVKYVYPTLVMGRDNLWQGIGADGFKYLDHIPQDVRAGRPNDTRMTLEVKNKMGTNSLFQVAGSDNPDSLRGGNAKLYVYSEWSEQDPYAWDVVEPILRENDGIAIFNFTPRGDNHARALYEYAKARQDQDWFVQLLTAEDTGIFSMEQLEGIKKDISDRFAANGRSHEEAVAYFEQEYMCSFKAPVVGSYYGAPIQKAEREGRITNVPYDSSIPVNTYWDLGVDDSMTIWCVQGVGKEIRMIDYIENSGEGIQYYIKELQSKGYVFGKHYGPHDLEVREMGSDAKTRREIAKSLGLDFQIAPKLSVDDGINAARTIFSRCWFDKTKCNRGIQALKNYKKDWDEKNKVFRKHPKHDWSSHGADSFRYFAVSYSPQNTFEVETPGWANKSPDWSRR